MEFLDIVFYAFAIIVVASAAFVVFSKNIMYAAFSLLFTFFGVAGLYVLLSADFLAITQILIYIGGILVLIIFGVLLTTKVADVDIKSGVLHVAPAAIIIAIIAGTLCGIFWNTKWATVQSPNVNTTIDAIGEVLLTDYLLPFEVASVLLLIAIIGATFIARKKENI
jgi:NADH-quinone oxidoreductase subunit J